MGNHAAKFLAHRRNAVQRPDGSGWTYKVRLRYGLCPPKYLERGGSTTVNGTPGFGKKVSCTISRNGDLITNVFLEIKMKKKSGATKTWWPAEALIKEVELEIGGQRIDRHNSTWFRIYDELFRKDDDKAAYRRLVDFTAEEQAATGQPYKRFYVPLVFFFNQNPGLAIPLIALTLQGHKSILPRASGPCAWENQLSSQDALVAPSQMLVACC